MVIPNGTHIPEDPMLTFKNESHIDLKFMIHLLLKIPTIPDYH